MSHFSKSFKTSGSLALAATCFVCPGGPARGTIKLLTLTLQESNPNKPSTRDGGLEPEFQMETCGKMTVQLAGRIAFAQALGKGRCCHWWPALDVLQMAYAKMGQAASSRKTCWYYDIVFQDSFLLLACLQPTNMGTTANMGKDQALEYGIVPAKSDVFL